jgi:HAD superfamily hydrolase (TIGR01450 family)
MLLSEGWASGRPDAAWACRRYEEIRARLPSARFPTETRRVGNLGDLLDQIDVFVLDGYGVLNVGTDPVPGAVARIAALRAAGKRLFVLTNGATYPHARTVDRYTRLGYDFAPAEVASSRDALARGMAGRAGLRWGFAATPESAITELAPHGFLLGDEAAAYDAAEGFILLGAGGWNRARHERMTASLRRAPRPVLVGNPDLVAPREDGLSLEPGCFAHDLAERTGIVPEFHGKPFGNAFALVAGRIGPDTPRHRIAMVGDTPHTDILGGAAMGWRTVLVRDHGLMKGMSLAEIAALSDIRPNFIARTT